MEKMSESHILSLFVFRLGSDWFALPVNCFKEVIEERKLHSIPHAKNNYLRGLVNHSGQLKVCFDLHKLLNVNRLNSKSSSHYFAAFEKEGTEIIFEIDEASTINQIDSESLKQSQVGYTKGRFQIGNKTVDLIDDELIFKEMIRGLL